MQIGRDQHEPEIGFRRHDTQREQLRGFERANFLDKRRERDLRRPLLLRAEQVATG